MLRLITLGGLSLESDSVADTHSLSPRRLALLAVIGAAGRSGITRDALLAIFWPESGQERARNALSQALFVVRRGLPDGALVDRGLDLLLNPAVLQCDATEFDDAVDDDANLEAAVSFYRGKFLDGVHIRDSEEFEEWRERTAARLSERYEHVLERLATEAENAGDATTALRWWKQLAAADPLSSRVAIRLLGAFVAAGDPVSAYRHARAHDALVREQMGTGDPSVLDFAARILEATESPASLAAIPSAPSTSLANVTPRVAATHGRGWRRQALIAGVAGIIVVSLAAGVIAYARGGAAKSITTVAVLPLSVIDASNVPSIASFVRDGLAEELINGLVHVRGLRVVARTSTFRLLDSAAPPVDVAKQLRADAVIAGSIQRFGPDLRVSMRVVRGSDGEVTWAGTFQRDTANLYSLEQDVVVGVAAALRPGPDTRSLIGPGETRNSTAYSLYLEALYQINRRRPEDLKRGLALLTRAVQLDSSFSMAYALIAQTYILLSPGYSSGTVAAHLAADAARRAIAIDDRVSSAHSALAAAYQIDLDWKSAEREFRRALELNPSDALSRSWFGFLLFYTGHPTEALIELEAARRLDPLNIGITANLAWGYYFGRRYDHAVEVFRQALQIEPNQPAMYNGVGRALQQLGRGDEAIAAYRRAVEMAGRPQGIAFLVAGLARFGQPAQARALERELRSTPNADAYSLTIASVGVGDIDQAFTDLTRATQTHAPSVIQVSVDPIFDPLRGDPRYATVKARLGL